MLSTTRRAKCWFPRHAENLSWRGCGWYQDRGRAFCASTGNFRTRGVRDPAGARTAARSRSHSGSGAQLAGAKRPGPGTIAAIGVSCGSPLDRVKGIVQAPPNLPTWVDVPICRLLGEAFHAPCRLENDANAARWRNIDSAPAWAPSTWSFSPWVRAWVQASSPPAACTWEPMGMRAR